MVSAAAVGSTDERTDTGASHQAHRNIFFFKNFEDTDMRDAAGETAAQRQPYAAGGLRLFRAGEARQAASEGLYRTNDLAQMLHRNLIFSRLPRSSYPA